MALSDLVILMKPVDDKIEYKKTQTIVRRKIINRKNDSWARRCKKVITYSQKFLIADLQL